MLTCGDTNALGRTPIPNWHAYADEPLNGVVREPRSERAQVFGRRIGVRPLLAEQRVGRAIDIVPSDLPVIENLQRRLARTVAPIPRSHVRNSAGAFILSAARAA